MNTTYPPREKYVPRYQRPNFTEVQKTHEAYINEVHPACLSIPEIGPRDFDNLVDSIKSRGLMSRILITKQGMLLDGRCRLAAMHVLGMRLGRGNIHITDADPTAIAETNFARRHLSVGQRIVLATKLLEKERAASKERKRKGAEKGRNHRKRSLVTGSVTSKTQTKRPPSSVDKISRQEGISRDELKRAEYIKKNKPELFGKVASDEVTWDEAKKTTEEERSLNRTPKQKRQRQRPKAKTANAKASESTFADELTSIRDSKDGVRIVDCGDVIVVRKHKTNATFFAYCDGGKWRYGTKDSNEHLSAESKDEAIQVCLSFLK